MSTHFDSKDLHCKSPFGAVLCGTKVSFSVFLAPEDAICGGTLRIWEEFTGTNAAFPAVLSENRLLFTYTAPAQPELVWYDFCLTTRDGRELILDRDGGRWQLTVYDASRPTPDWFGRGISYQIFPDRFCRSRIPDGRDMVGSRVVHEQWGDMPVFLPDEQGIVRNCDFFGGDLRGILQKLDYLQSLSVTTLYCNPIFESASNHRYDTADYLAIDPMLGSEDDFRILCREAHKRGMRVILDGVFNHTGSNSRYFNAEGFYPELGAAQSDRSPFYKWYHFSHWPAEYAAWWGIRTLPAVEEHEPSYRAFIAGNDNAVVRHWLRLGADGWRLDVADELPDDFIAEIRQAADDEKTDSILLGEVWEDGSNKIAYSQRRRYLLGSETHGLMNYPFRTAAIQWLLGGNAADFRHSMETIRENYPTPAFYSAMNFLGTHDTPRILTLLGASSVPESKGDRAAYRLSAEEHALAMRRLMLGSLLLYTFPGSPTVYYGDEAGMEGFEDPLNRATYPWGAENAELLHWYRLLGRLRSERDCLQCGDLIFLQAQGGILTFRRSTAAEQCTTVCNAGSESVSLELPWNGPRLVRDALSGQQFFVQNGVLHISVPPISGMLLV